MEGQAESLDGAKPTDNTETRAEEDKPETVTTDATKTIGHTGSQGDTDAGHTGSQGDADTQHTCSHADTETKDTSSQGDTDTGHPDSQAGTKTGHTSLQGDTDTMDTGHAGSQDDTEKVSNPNQGDTSLPVVSDDTTVKSTSQMPTSMDSTSTVTDSGSHGAVSGAVSALPDKTEDVQEPMVNIATYSC